uniref:Corepressor interacting with RBPJ 1 n=1 Tax=Romanomermis culicivorax TaxID=13658 RepID=A0A915IKZ4_ROMCU
VFVARKKAELEKKKQDDLRAQYDKEQELLNNKALLGDEKARLGLAFMYELPAGLKKDETEVKPALEPKFEWQRKYNAPREEWAKGDESISDQPFGIQVRNVRCVKCHTWGHVNTDRECPLYNMSGTKEDPGSNLKMISFEPYIRETSTNPSDLIREAKRRKVYTVDESCPPPGPSSSSTEPKREKIDNEELMREMKSEYGLTLKNNIVEDLRVDKALENIDKKAVDKPTVKNFEDWFYKKSDSEQQQMMFRFLSSITPKERSKIFNA